jgi:hypothetical protein
MATALTGQREWKGRREDDGNYTFQVTHRVLCNPGEGPYAVLMAEGLPQPGDLWKFNIDPVTGAAGEQMIWAYCGMGADAEQQTADGSPGKGNASYWDVSQTFSTKPPGRTQPAGDPLLEPQKVTGSFSRTSKEALNDRFGIPITNSAWERFHGQQVEFDSGHTVVNVEQNVAELNLPALVAAYQTVNGLPLWGMPKRTIKLSGISWDPHDYTRADPLTGAPIPSRYYTRKFEFEANWEGWDRDLLDEANKVLHGHWKYITTTTTTTTQAATTTVSGPTTAQASTTTTPGPISGPEPVQWELLPVDGAGTMPNRFNPTHFDRFQDRWGNVGKVILNGAGIPAGSVAPLGKFYVSAQGDNFQHGLTDGDWWIPLAPGGDADTYPTYDPTFFPAYDPGIEYDRGSLVTYGGQKYISHRSTVIGELVGGPSNPFYWLLLPSGTTNAGFYSVTTPYNLGDYVEAAAEIAAGKIHVEKYNESDFVGGLGIPTTL